jgi:hypothetical protein
MSGDQAIDQIFDALLLSVVRNFKLPVCNDEVNGGADTQGTRTRPSLARQGSVPSVLKLNGTAGATPC